MLALAADIEAKTGAVGTWRIYAVVLLIVGLAVGYFAESMMKKS